jgi:hypothetical protein
VTVPEIEPVAASADGAPTPQSTRVAATVSAAKVLLKEEA